MAVSCAGPRDVSPVHGLASVAAVCPWAKAKHQDSPVLNLQHHLLNLQREPRARTGRTAGDVIGAITRAWRSAWFAHTGRRAGHIGDGRRAAR